MLLLSAFALILAVSRGAEGLAERKRADDILYLPSSTGVKAIALGYRNLASDLLWFRAVQYYGGYRLGENGLKFFRHLANVITDLDPQFIFAYQLSAVILAEDIGAFDEGIKILEKGMSKNPDNWLLFFEAGFLHYLSGKDYGEAGRYFELASKKPGADERALRFAASAAAKGGDVEASIEMWKKLAETSNDPFMAELAEGYIERLRDERDKEAGEE
jgi:tetratricopeptide (TPR) repeat protein